MMTFIGDQEDFKSFLQIFFHMACDGISRGIYDINHTGTAMGVFSGSGEYPDPFCFGNFGKLFFQGVFPLKG